MYYSIAYVLSKFYKHACKQIRRSINSIEINRGKVEGPSNKSLNIKTLENNFFEENKRSVNSASVSKCI